MRGLEKGTVHPTATVADSARLASGVTVGAHAIIYDNVVVGGETTIGAHCVLGEPTIDYYSSDRHENQSLIIGARAILRSGAIMYAGSIVGDHFHSGHHATIREGCRIGHHCSVGTLSDVQDHCSLGDYVRLHSHVFVAPGTVLQDFVWMFPHSVLANDPHPPSIEDLPVTIEAFAVIAASAVVLPGVRVGRDAVVAAMALVREDVEAETVVAGVPAKRLGSIHEVESAAGEPVYPWRYHFDRGMPWEGLGFDAWDESAGLRSSGSGPPAAADGTSHGS